MSAIPALLLLLLLLFLLPLLQLHHVDLRWHKCRMAGLQTHPYQAGAQRALPVSF